MEYYYVRFSIDFHVSSEKRFSKTVILLSYTTQCSNYVKYYSDFSINPVRDLSFWVSWLSSLLSLTLDAIKSHGLMNRNSLFHFSAIFYHWKDKFHKKKNLKKNSKKFENKILAKKNLGEKKFNEDFEFREVETSEWKLGHVSPANHLSKRKEKVLVIYHADHPTLRFLQQSWVESCWIK